MPLKPAGLQTHIWNNNVISLIILAVYPVLIMILVWACTFVIIGVLQNFTDTPHAHMVILPASEIASQSFNRVLELSPIIIGVICGWFLISYYFNQRLIMKISGAHSVRRAQEPELYNLLENLCIAQGIPMPDLNIIETHGRNAFASGMNEKTYAITVTRGLLRSLKKDELEAVLAHELTHILNHDVRLMTVTVIFTGMVGLAFQLCDNFFRYNRFNRFHMHSSRRNKNDGAFIMAALAIYVILGIGYLLTCLMRFFLSRTREYMADAGAVQLTKNPEAMMRALMRIAGRDQMPTANGEVALMYIENSQKFMGIFATHPPIAKRLTVLAITNNISIPSVKSLGPAPKSERISSAEKPSSPWLTQQRYKR